MLRTSLISSTILVAMFAGGVAFSDEPFGTIKSVDDAAKTVTLGDGIVYQLKKDSLSYEMAGGYLPGGMVVVDAGGVKHDVVAIGPDFTHGINGDVKAVDATTKTVTLSDGEVYSFESKSGPAVDLKFYRVGDEVTIVATKDGTTNAARAISGHSETDETGKLKAINESERLVTLESGAVYSFLGKDGKDIALGGFKVGEMVKIEAIDVGINHWGYTISTDKG